jgi:hypothetical protein
MEAFRRCTVGALRVAKNSLVSQNVSRNSLAAANLINSRMSNIIIID